MTTPPAVKDTPVARTLSTAPTLWALGGVALLAGLVVVADQLSKAWIVAQYGLTAAVHHQPIWPGILDLDYVENRGAAFGLFPNAGWTLGVMAALVSAAILYLVPRLQARPGGAPRWLLLALALVLGGALGNLVDRMQHGSVVDFLTPTFARITLGGTFYRFPTFNVADSAITVGVGLLLLGFWLWPENVKRDA